MGEQGGAGGQGETGARWRRATPGQVLAIVCVGMILANLDLFIVNVGLPNIAAEFHDGNLAHLSWILNAYTITYASLLVFFGRLAERYRRDWSFLVGIGLFTAASAACAAVDSIQMLVFFRIVQAAAAALMTPTSLGLLLASYPPERRGAAVRTWTAIGGLGAALGPLVGGVLVTFSWRWIFLVNVPLGLMALIVGWIRLPHITGHVSGKPDALAAALVTMGIACLTFAIVKVNDWGWRSWEIQVSFVVAIVFLGWFVRHCLTAANPLIEPALFKIRAFMGASLVMAPFAAGFGALLLSVVLWEESVWHWRALHIGMAMAPGPLLVPLVSLLFSKRLIATFGAASVITAGILSFTIGLLWWSFVPGVTAQLWVAVIGMVPIGVGVGLTLPTLMGVGTAALPPSSFATGSGAINMIRQAAMAIGVAVLVALLGTPDTVAERVAAFRLAWWIMAAIMITGIVPTALYVKARKVPASAEVVRPSA
jgi:EmrB/QacA subfamily drug resistance transporter